MSDPFPETYWSIIERAVRKSRGALNRIALDYVAPVRAFIARSGFTPEDSEDLAQEVFLIVCDPEFLKQADASKGKFRTLILLVAKNVMNGEWRKRYAKKRAGKAISLDRETVAEMFAAPSPDDDAFDREWWASLLEAALAQLKREDTRRHEILRLHKQEERSHAAIAEELSISQVQVNNEVRAGKKRLREILMERVQSYCSTSVEYREELAQLKRRLA